MRYLIGVGNYCAWDDSIGLRIVEHIAEHKLERGFQAIDLSGNLINIMTYLERGTESILVVDSARMGIPPGEYTFFKSHEVETVKDLSGMTTHEGDLLKVLELARQTGHFIPPITFMGIEPESVKNEMGLSPALASRLPQYAAAASARCLEG